MRIHEPIFQQTSHSCRSLLRSADLVDAVFVALQVDTEGRRRGKSRRLILTAEALLERRPSTYEVAERRSLGALAALVRFADQPQWLGLEWTDGAPPTMYITTAREAVLTAVLDIAQVVNLFLMSIQSLLCSLITAI